MNNTTKKSKAPDMETLRKTNLPLFNKIADEQMETMNWLNSRIAQVKVGGKVRYVDSEDAQYAFYTKNDMADILAPHYVTNWKQESVPAFRWWLTQEDRREFNGVVFEPDKKKAPAGALNLFRGFSVKPKAKEDGWRLYRDHLFRNVCRGDVESYEYMLNWKAHIFQRPGQKIGNALVLYSDEKGTGKTFVSDVMAHLVGTRYAPVVSTPEELTQKHNSHLAQAVLICVEEALNSRDPRHEAKVKHMITGGRFLVEFKNIDAVQIDSKSNLIFTTNKLNSVAATHGERRYAMYHVGADNKQDKKFFDALTAELLDGGYEAFLFDLLARDISKVDFTRPPTTALLGRQILEGMTGLDRWWASTLAEGRLPFARTPEFDTEDVEWPDTGEGWTVPKAALQESAANFVRSFQGVPSAEAIGKFLLTTVPGIQRGRRRHNSEREHVYILPKLEACRQAFVAARPGLNLYDLANAIPETVDDVTPKGYQPAPATARNNVIPLVAG